MTLPIWAHLLSISAGGVHGLYHVEQVDRLFYLVLLEMADEVPLRPVPDGLAGGFAFLDVVFPDELHPRLQRLHYLFRGSGLGGGYQLHAGGQLAEDLVDVLGNHFASGTPL